MQKVTREVYVQRCIDLNNWSIHKINNMYNISVISTYTDYYKIMLNLHSIYIALYHVLLKALYTQNK